MAKNESGAQEGVVALTFAPHVLAAGWQDLSAWAAQIRAALEQHRVGEFPDRYEPRAYKRRCENYQQLRIFRVGA